MNGKNADLNTADNDIQPSQLAADHGNTGTATSEIGKVSVLNRRTLGVAAVLGLLFASLLAGTLFFTSADDSASPAPKVDANTVSGNTVSAHAQIKPAEFSTANSFYHSVLDPANVSASPKAGRALAASRNQGAAETSAAQPSSTDGARSQCSGAACVSPRRAPVATGVKLKLFKLGVADSKLVRNCTVGPTMCSAADGELVAGARFALYKGRTADEANKVGEYIVGKDGLEISDLQVNQSYVLKEIEAPAGYELNTNNVSLNVKSDGVVQRRYSKFYKDLVNNEFYIPNLKAPVPEVWLFKLGVADLAVCDWGSCSADNGVLLDGAEFALYEGTVLDKDHKVGENFTVGQDGLKIPGLQVGKTYSLVEVTSPAGYQVNRTDLTFEVDADGKAKYQTDAGSQFFVENKIFVPNQKAAPPAVKFKLFKLGVADSKLVRNCTVGPTMCSAADGELVAGARFALYKGRTADEANKVGEYIVGKDGLEISDLQVNQSYVLKEIEAPAGYELNTNNVSLNVKSDGVVQRRYSKFYKDLVNNEFYIPNLKAPVPEVWLFKLGVADLAVCDWGSCSADNGVLLDGAEFALYEGTVLDKDHKVGENFTVGQDGLKIPGLQVGKTYSLLEVRSPAGYEANGARYTFEVDADGKAQYQTDNGSEFFVDNKIYFPNKKVVPPTGKFRLFKLGVADSALVRKCMTPRTWCSAGDGELIAGAKFALYKGSRVDEANKVGEYTVGEGGVEISDLQVNQSYTLKEVEAPAGYELNPDTTVFKVFADGKVGGLNGKRYKYFDNNEFYFPNLKVQTIDISLNKVSDKDTPLENVKFDLYEADNLDKPLQTITTGNDGKANLTVMPGRKYRLVETQTYPGYALLPQAIEFQVDANGTVTIDKQNGNANTVTGGDKTLKVVNYPEGKLPLSGQSGFLLVLLSGLSLLLVAVAISLVGRKRQ